MSGLYRKNVGIVVFNSNQKVLMCARANRPGFDWQFPQGGIEDGETPVAAAFRELQEETGITSVEVVTTLSQPLRYDFPPDILAYAKKLGRPHVGQEQYWVLMYFTGHDEEINLETHPEEIEFKAYEWVDIEEAPKRIIEFKKDVYMQMTAFFKPFIFKSDNK